MRAHAVPYKNVSERTPVKIRNLVLLVAALLASALLLAACGSDDKDSKSSKKLTKTEQAAAKDAENKQKTVSRAEKEFKKAKDDVNACRNLAMAYIAKASPASTDDPKKAPELPKDRDESLKSATKTLETCADLGKKDRGVQQMLASTYMAQSDYDKAAPLLEQLAKSAKADERANAYYAWGLAESNAQDFAAAIRDWNGFLSAAPNNDPRLDQVRQSIKSLRAALKAPKKAATETTTKDDASSDSSKDDDSSSKSDDEGGDDDK
jgi:cytochrome c-type biogenesis protein CcmH/NrfG